MRDNFSILVEKYGYMKYKPQSGFSVNRLILIKQIKTLNF